MTTYEIIKARHSVRAFLDKPIEPKLIDELNELIEQCNQKGNLNISLVTNEPDAFGKSLMAHYGKFRNVRNYFCLAADKHTKPEERIGYYGEKLVLLAQKLGLNTCWVGLTFKRGKTKCHLNTGEKIYALIAVGYGETQGHPSKSKTPQQICAEIDSMPDWFRQGVEYALLAPTALHQQKFRFAMLTNGSVSATTSWGPYSKIDLGIARLHFELGANRDVCWATD